ncbi:hypothetical protein BGZ67_010532 [Mortierella alpina]|nr:hypothetical protein BGZ67_010532 [Mortierella alpina]
MLVMQEVSGICAIFSRKALMDKQVVYIINNVLIPRILYRLTTTILSKTEIRAIVSKYRTVVRQKLGYARGTPHSLLYHRRFYGLRHFGNVQDEEQISTALLRINDHGLVGQVMQARLDAHQEESKVYKGLASQMGKDKVHWLLDVATDDGQALASWSEFKQRHNIRGLIRNWYLELCKVICTPEDDAEATSDDDVEDVVEALEVEEVEPFEVVEPLEVVELVEAAAMVAVNARASTESDKDSKPLEDPRQRRRAERVLQTATVAGTPDRYVMVHAGTGDEVHGEPGMATGEEDGMRWTDATLSIERTRFTIRKKVSV